MKIPQQLDDRMEFLEHLLEEERLTTSQFNTLDAVARVEAGLLTFEEMASEFLR